VRRARCLLAGLLAAVSLAACLSPARVALEELPDEPLAVVYFEPEDARRRAEILEQSFQGPAARREREGVASLEQLGALFGAGTPEHEDVLRRLDRFPGRLCLVDPATGELTRLEAAPAGARPLAWSRDHRRLLFSTRALSGRFQIYEYDRDEGVLRRLTHGESHVLADYGPDGALVYTSIEGEPGRYRGGIRYRSGDGGPDRTVASAVPAGSLRVSPAGDVVVYTLDDPEAGVAARGGTLLVAVDLEDGEEHVLTRGRDPSFSPDGEWIVYTALVQRGFRLWRMRSDGSARAPLGKPQGNEGMPAVSPDGRFVAYVGREGERDRLFVRRFDGTGERVLVGEGAVAWPVW
jgi:Tol biopolymer transport system component